MSLQDLIQGAGNAAKVVGELADETGRVAAELRDINSGPPSSAASLPTTGASQGRPTGPGGQNVAGLTNDVGILRETRRTNALLEQIIRTPPNAISGASPSRLARRGQRL